MNGIGENELALVERQKRKIITLAKMIIVIILIIFAVIFFMLYQSEKKRDHRAERGGRETFRSSSYL